MCVFRLQLLSRSCSEVERSAFPEARCEVMRQRPENALAKTYNHEQELHPSCNPGRGRAFRSGHAARAQIASYVDEHGKLVFVNGDSPKPRRGSTISPTPALAFPVWDFVSVYVGVGANDGSAGSHRSRRSRAA